MTASTQRVLSAQAQDSEIVARLKAGDMSACTACVNAYSDSLYRLAYRILRDEAAAEDIVQETFLNAFRGLDKFDDRSRLSTWLFRIAYNNALMRLRSQRPTTPLEDEDDGQAKVSAIVPWEETPEQVLSKQELKEVLDGAISSLSRRAFPGARGRPAMRNKRPEAVAGASGLLFSNLQREMADFSTTQTIRVRCAR